MTLYAHSENTKGKRQPLADHLRNVAALARERARPFGGGDLAFLAGLWHDAGKADPEWQRYLRESEAGTRGRGTGPDHKCAGVLLAEENRHPWYVGHLIHAHHGGLADPQTGFRAWLSEKRDLPGPSRALEAMQAELPDLLDQPAPAIPLHVKDALAAEFFLRMTYSALVDADSLDTEAHKLSGVPSSRGGATMLPEL